MTAPDGAYVIGGGEWNYGQNVDTNLVLNMIRPLPSPVDALGQFRDTLMKMPLDALKAFQPFLDAADDVFSNVGSAVQAIIDALLNSPVFMTLAAFGEWVSSAFKPVQELLGDAFDQIQRIFGWLGELVDAFVDGWLDLFDGGWTIPDVFNTSNQIQQAITSLQTMIANLAAAFDVDFADYPNGLPGPKWSSWHSGSGNGVIKIDKGRMYLSDAPFLVGTRKGWTRYNATPSKSDFHRVGVAFGSAIQTNILGASAENLILGRVGTGDTPLTSSYVYVRMGNTGAEIGYKLAGVERTTVLKTDRNFRFNLSSSYWLECGVRGTGGAPDAPYTFRLYENNKFLFEGIDGSRQAPFGANNRYCGLGFENPALNAAKVASFAVQDK